MAREDVGLAAIRVGVGRPQISAVRLVNGVGEIQPVPELVQEHCDEVVLRAVVVVESEVEVEVAAELAVDVGEAGVQIGSGALVGERREIPCIRELRAGVETRAAEIGEDERGARASEHVRGERIEGRLNDDGHGAVEGSAPDVGGVFERDDALLPLRRAGIAADRHGRRRVVEAFAGVVEVDDRDGGSSGECRGRAGENHHHGDKGERTLCFKNIFSHGGSPLLILSGDFFEAEEFRGFFH